MKRKLGTRVDVHQDELGLYKQVLAQKKKDKKKVYSLTRDGWAMH
jgi:IS5 family transposase